MSYIESKPAPSIYDAIYEEQTLLLDGVECVVTKLKHGIATVKAFSNDGTKTFEAKVPVERLKLKPQDG